MSETYWILGGPSTAQAPPAAHHRCRFCQLTDRPGAGESETVADPPRTPRTSQLTGARRVSAASGGEVKPETWKLICLHGEQQRRLLLRTQCEPPDSRPRLAAPATRPGGGREVKLGEAFSKTSQTGRETGEGGGCGLGKCCVRKGLNECRGSALGLPTVRERRTPCVVWGRRDGAGQADIASRCWPTRVEIR